MLFLSCMEASKLCLESLQRTIEKEIYSTQEKEKYKEIATVEATGQPQTYQCLEPTRPLSSMERGNVNVDREKESLARDTKDETTRRQSSLYQLAIVSDRVPFPLCL